MRRRNGLGDASAGGRTVQDETVRLAKETLQNICGDAAAPAAAKAQAARTLLELAGALKGTPAKDTVPLAEMTASELDTALARLARGGASRA